MDVIVSQQRSVPVVSDWCQDWPQLVRATPSGESQAVGKLSVGFKDCALDDAGFLWLKAQWPRLFAELALDAANNSPVDVQDCAVRADVRYERAQQRAPHNARGKMSGALGALGVLGRVELDLHLCLPLVCQRCLQPAVTEVNLTRYFHLVESEAVAERIETATEGGKLVSSDWLEFDEVLVLSQPFDWLAWLEEEALLALPMLVLHETCDAESLEKLSVRLALANQGKQKSAPVEAASSAKTKPNPFAVLAGLKK
jgi:uncharacterized metal-binding protein YceD (DUF177 family)